MNRWILCLLVLTIMASARFADAEPRKLTIAEAEGLVLVEIGAEQGNLVKLPGFEIAHYKVPWAPDSVIFDANWTGTKEVYGLIGHYEVNMTTGDVNDGVICREYRSAALRRAQTALRAKLHMDAKTYRRIRHPGWMC